MTIDLNLLREDKGGNLSLVRESEKKRFRPVDYVTQALKHDELWRKKNFDLECIRKQLNDASKQVGDRKKKNKDSDCTDILESIAILKKQISDLEDSVSLHLKNRDNSLGKIGNIVDKSVPVSDDEKDNRLLREWGDCSRKATLTHPDIMIKLGILDIKKGSEIAGHRGYFLKESGVFLNQALINYGLCFLNKKGYQLIQPPYFMKREIMLETAELEDFSSSLYKLNSDDSTEKKDDLFLIATSEQPISALHRGEYILPSFLPLKYAGVSPCFRKEAGSYGKDMRGIFRVHQFEKVEQFVITAPESAQETHEEMIKVSEEFYQSLGIPYRVVEIVSGAMNNAASKKYDLEAWFPGERLFRELVSCSNCTDYQSRPLNIRLGYPNSTDREKKFVYMLNGTLVATERAMCCILENYQTESGVKIPQKLVPFMDGLEFLQFSS